MKYEKKTILIIIAIILIFFISSVIFIEFRIKTIRQDVSEFTAKNAASSAILNGVEATLKDAEIYYSDVVELCIDDNGNVKSISTNTSRLNTVSNSVNKNVDKRISEMKNIPVKIPVSSFFGDEIVSGLGPEITFYITMTGNASTKIDNVFESTGVNQTIHRIMIDISVEVYVIFGKKIEKYNISSNVCVAESVIVGNIPDALAQFANK